MSNYERNRTVAALRGDQWRSNLVRGKMEAQFFPSSLKIARVKKLVSQYDLAKMSGISLASLGGVERGKRPVKAKVAEKIAAALDTTVDKLFKKNVDGKLFAILPKKS